MRRSDLSSNVHPSDLILAFAGLVAGLLSGLMGVGGGFLLVPALAIAGWKMTSAVGMSLVFVTVMGLAGSLSHIKRGNVDWPIVKVAAVPAVIGAQLGAFGSAGLPGWFLRAAFAGVLLYAAHEMTRPLPAATDGQVSAVASAGLGGIVGVLSGLLGVGGGVLLVPGQCRWMGVPLKRAIGNSMALVVLTGVAGIAGHLAFGHLDVGSGAWLVVGGLVGVRLGLWLLRWISPVGLRTWFAAFLVTLAVLMIATAALRAPLGLT